MQRLLLGDLVELGHLLFVQLWQLGVRGGQYRRHATDHREN